jgi:hypothetical protein
MLQQNLAWSWNKSMNCRKNRRLSAYLAYNEQSVVAKWQVIVNELSCLIKKYYAKGFHERSEWF